jgi:hypothetical protein
VLHTLIGVLLVLVAFILNTNVATLSQPAALVRILVNVPAPLYAVPFHVYGKAVLHTLNGVLLILVALTVKFNVAVLSHPAALVKRAV